MNGYVIKKSVEILNKCVLKNLGKKVYNTNYNTQSYSQYKVERMNLVNLS